MKELVKHIARFSNTELNSPCIITDDNLTVVSFNKPAEELFQDIHTGKEITGLKSDKFSPEIFNDREKILSAGKIQIYTCNHLEFDSNKRKVIITEFRAEGEKYFQIVIIDTETEAEIPVFTDYSFEEIPVSEDVKKLIDRSLQEYPFTLVEEKDFKRKIDGYPLPFWIKGTDNELKICNREFVEKYAGPSGEILKREESEILPIKLSLLFEKTARIISLTAMPIFIIEHNLTPESDVNQKFWLLQYPILDKENRVLGIISVECEIFIEEIEIDCNGKPRKAKENLFDDKGVYSLTGNMLEHLIKILPEPVYVYDSETLNILEANQKAAELYGYELDELKNLTVADLYSPENVQILLEVSKAEFNSKDKIGPVQHQKKDGTLFEVEILNSDILFNGKKAQVNVLQPVENEEKTKPQTEKSEKEIFNDLEELVIITDKNGFITFANEAVEKKLGYEKRYLDNHPFFSLIDKKNWEWLSDIFSEAESRKERFSFETNIKSADGKLIEARLNGIPLSRSDEEFYAFVINLTEPEERKPGQTEKEIEVVGNGKTLDFNFLSDLFHEILTPINVILGFTHEIIEGLENPTEEQNESAEIIWQNQKILLQIMDAASQYALLESGKMKLDLRKIPVSKIFEDVSHNLSQFFEENGVKFVVPESEGEIETDAKRFGIILTTVIKLAASVGKTGNLFAESKPVNGKIVISFADTEGVASNEFLEKLKAVFISNEFTDVQNYGISGIVIRLVKKLARLFNAGFEILTEDGVPAKFAILIPEKFEESLSTEEKPTGEKTETNGKSKEREEAEIIGFHQNEKAIEETREEKSVEIATGMNSEDENRVESNIENLSCFYLEDQFDSRLLFENQMKDLKKIGFAESLEKALPLLVKEKYDFILMDIRLAGDFNGIDALKIVKSLPGYENVPVIAVTAYTEAGDREKYLSLGFSEYIPKPFLRKEVMEALRKLGKI